MGRKLELAIGALNGAVGDYLVRTGNGLATDMAFVHEGDLLPLAAERWARALPAATPRVVVMLHGLMCTEDIWEFPDGTGDYGAFLARDFGFTPLRVRYNSGLNIPDNGAALASLLDALAAVYPVPIEEILLLGYSMGGLVVRGACHVATEEGHGWLSRVKRAFYVGTPHRGAPLERVGRVLAKVLRAVPDPYTRLAADLAELRSDGVKDLGDGDVRHEDRARRVASVSLRDPRHPVPLLPQIRHYLVAGTLSADPRFAKLFGDTMVPVPSAMNDQRAGAAEMAFPPSHVKILPGLAHVPLAHHPDVYAQLRAWCEEVSE
jgi:pimeloyl-ACP methyl ester carboxylesterase